MAASSPAKKATNRRATPAKKAGPAAKAAPATEVTAPAGVFDLDTLDKREAFPDLGLPDKPFQFLLAGVQYELGDPRDNDWKEAWQLATNPFLLMRSCLVGADDPVEDPTEDEITNARVRLGLGPRAEEEQDGEAAEDGEDEDDEKPKLVVTLIDRFTAAPLPGWKLNALLENWHKHYKIDLSKGRGILDALLGRDHDADE